MSKSFNQKFPHHLVDYGLWQSTLIGNIRTIWMNIYTPCMCNSLQDACNINPVTSLLFLSDLNNEKNKMALNENLGH